MADADSSRQWLLLKLYTQISQLALGAAAFNLSIDQRGNSCRVVAAVFQPRQSFDQKRGYISISYNTDDSAHDKFSYSLFMP
jgi:hypothetical protein